jgi:hypothetical protein
MSKEFTMIGIESDPSDLKVCKDCNCLNWHENESCINPDCTSSSFDESEGAVSLWHQKERGFYVEEEGYSEEEFNELFVEV